MIEEDAFVVYVEAGGYAWIETQDRVNCQGCTRDKKCGTATLARWMRPRMPRIRVLDPINTRVGERVVVGIDEQALLKGSFAVYMVPLICMIGVSMLGGHFAAGSTNEEVISLLCGLFGLGIGLTWLFRHGRKTSMDSRCQPIVLRRIPPQENS